MRSIGSNIVALPTLDLEGRVHIDVVPVLRRLRLARSIGREWGHYTVYVMTHRASGMRFPKSSEH